MKRLIQLPRFPEMYTFKVMNIIYDELTEAFKDYDCEIKVIETFEDLRNEGIIFIDNGVLIHNRAILDKISEKCPDSVYFCWYWVHFNHYTPIDFTPINYKPFKYMIYTGNNYLITPTIPHLIDELNKYTILTNFCPIKLRANEHPDLVGTYKRNVERDYCFMGGGYKIDWVPSEYTGIYHQVINDNYIPYNKRREIYLSSVFAFGFHNDITIDCGSISQRVFEGMAYGCIVLSDNPAAEKLTDGIVVTVTSKNDLIEKMNFYKHNPDLIIEKQNKGYEWVKKYGTNRYSVKLLLDKVKEVYNLEFE